VLNAVRVIVAVFLILPDLAAQDKEALRQGRALFEASQLALAAGDYPRLSRASRESARIFHEQKRRAMSRWRSTMSVSRRSIAANTARRCAASINPSIWTRPSATPAARSSG